MAKKRKDVVSKTLGQLEHLWRKQLKGRPDLSLGQLIGEPLQLQQLHLDLPKLENMEDESFVPYLETYYSARKNRR